MPNIQSEPITDGPGPKFEGFEQLSTSSWSCSTCWASVVPNAMRKHREWHEQQQ